MSEKIAIIFASPETPKQVRPLFKGNQTKFVDPKNKTMSRELKAFDPTTIVIEGGCPKMTKKLMSEYPGRSVFYVGGSAKQIRELPSKTTIVDNFIQVSENFRSTTSL